MLVKDLITLLKEYDDDTRVALPIHNSSNYSETIAHDYGDVLVLEGRIKTVLKIAENSRII